MRFLSTQVISFISVIASAKREDFAYSVRLHGKEVPKESKLILSDTTRSGKQYHFPRGRQIVQEVIDRCNKIAKKEGITLLSQKQKNNHSRTSIFRQSL